MKCVQTPMVLSVNSAHRPRANRLPTNPKRRSIQLLCRTTRVLAFNHPPHHSHAKPRIQRAQRLEWPHPNSVPGYSRQGSQERPQIGPDPVEEQTRWTGLIASIGVSMEPTKNLNRVATSDIGPPGERVKKLPSTSWNEFESRRTCPEPRRV